uniref:Uncharacterized protein n=1 Tax=Aureoumbra lagunensis TaxID=44058 RepID=A0A7S3NJG0_9STRA|mmetsp:Transcript_16801/g.25267  ORF Transcript_16801/g.25267 Transcript_16801/m.25267 type:complete len:207 (+) Transcript_16801:28-648(+)
MSDSSAMSTPPSLAILCIASLLEHADRYDESSRKKIIPSLQCIGLHGDAIIQAAGLNLRAFGGLRCLASDWTLVDDCRKLIATSLSTKLGTKYFEQLCERLTESTEVSIQTLDNVQAICKAMLGNERYKRDMEPPLLLRPVADACRRLRNRAQKHLLNIRDMHKHDRKRHSTGVQNWRFQDLRGHAGSLHPKRPMPRNPHFPGYDH